jgi:hypothetical protein
MSASQNAVEREFFSLVNGLLRLHGLVPIFVLDRGCADAELIRYFKHDLRAHFVIRGPGNVYVQLPGYAGRLSRLGRTGL